jgi:hypothetical protein
MVRSSLTTLAVSLIPFLAFPVDLAAKEPVDTMEIPADLTSSAKENFERGVFLFNAEDYKGALESFLKSYTMSPHSQIRYNIGLCYIHLKKDVLAATELELLAVEQGNEIDPDLLKQVEKAILELQKAIGTLVIDVDVKGAEIEVDGKKVGTSPLGRRIFLEPGDHNVHIRGEGGAEWTSTVHLEKGEKTTIKILITSPEKSAKIETVTQGGAEAADAGGEDGVKKKEDKKPKKERKNILAGLKPVPKGYAYGALGLTVAVAVAGAVLGGLAMQKSAKIDDLDKACVETACNGFSGPYATYVDRRAKLFDEADALAKASTALLVTAGAAAAATVLLFVFSGPWKREKKGKAFAAGGLLVRPGDGTATLCVAF